MNALALPPRTLTLPQAQTACPKWGNPQEAGKSEAPQVCWLSLWKCAGCLFGAMTKIPWHGNETKASHKVFIVTKPRECVSVDQMMPTKVGFYAQMKGKLTKKHYRCTTVFVDHYSRLRFVHLQVNNSSVKTVAAKRAFETFTVS